MSSSVRNEFLYAYLISNYPIDLTDILQENLYTCISQAHGPNVRFSLFQVSLKGKYFTSLLSLLSWLPHMELNLKACQTSEYWLTQLHAGHSAVQNSSAIAAFDTKWDIRQKSVVHPSWQICKWIYFIWKTCFFRWWLKLSRGWRDYSCTREPAFISWMALFSLTGQDTHMSAHSEMIKELLDARKCVTEWWHYA